MMMARLGVDRYVDFEGCDGRSARDVLEKRLLNCDCSQGACLVGHALPARSPSCIAALPACLRRQTSVRNMDRLYHGHGQSMYM